MPRTIRINGIDVPVIADELSGAQLKAAVGIEPDRVLVKQDPDRNTIVGDGQRVRLADGDTFAHHARHSKAQDESRAPLFRTVPEADGATAPRRGSSR
ncbi:hypothetical protein I6A60_06015 [Frankia sp. AgB1.9]|uniref:hypothetical protein n=1 Tax=unclassified Frankia TaxID=2632575 RepID=UPI001931BDEA|nr:MULTISPECIES: hypothetical protein [unclassified Frankia]MBL7487474.1 hypothetical protein [Frankia sp. AgW1.1]MBL7547436.1 hypothetical protein [Frankia sp. AgB1.9]MBL7618789.1 hypothetical protein [Frankia sp. AgB1.8]